MVTLAELASKVQSQVEVIDSYLKKHNLPQPTFDIDSPTELPPDADVQRARLRLIETAWSLSNLALGSADYLIWNCMPNVYDDVMLHFLVHFRVFDAVPREGSISYAELSKKVGVGEHRLRRVLNMAYTRHFFQEPKPGFVAHTSNSVLLIGDTGAWSMILHNAEEAHPWYAYNLVNSTVKWGDSKDPRHTGPNLNAKPGEEKTFFQIMEDDDGGEWGSVKGRGYRLWRLYDSDVYFGAIGVMKGTRLLKAFDWKGIGKGTVVDLSGVTGHLSIQIAQECPDLTFIVQEKDHAWLEKQFLEKLPADLKGTGRVRLMPHDRYAEQPIKGADVYFISTMLHKEPPEKIVPFLRRIADAMDPRKSRIVTRDIVMDGGDRLPEDVDLNGKAINGNHEEEYEAGLGPTGAVTRLNVGIDLQMLSVFNTFQRTRAEWIELFKTVDSRFVLKACIQTVGNCAAVMEWALEE